MSLNIVVGTQWGDEGKGHITDLMASEADLVARFGGGDNAGHTVTIGGDIYRLHLIPSGIVHKHVTCLIGNGLVVNPLVLLEEIDGLAKRGVDVSPTRLKLSRKAHLITPVHIALDGAKELARGEAAIGTTLRGIGPAYADKAARVGIRAGILAEPENLDDAVRAHTESGNLILTRMYGTSPQEPDEVSVQFATFSRRLAPYLADTGQILAEALRQGRYVLAEGAQGALLDLDHGTYPFVTSSWPTAGGALVGLGVGPKTVERIVGVAKAFTSRVGGGPFPTELTGDEAERLRGTGEQPWDEFGTTTGRPRRVGWLDTVILRYSARINSLTELALTKLDILSGLETIPVCTRYDRGGRRVDHFPVELEELATCSPVYETLPGWSEDISGARCFEDLPANARSYVEYVSRQVGVPVRYISVGPGREQIITRR